MLEYSGGEIIWSPADFVCLPAEKQMINIILMVGLF